MMYKLEEIDPNFFKEVFREKLNQELDFDIKFYKQLDSLDFIEIIMEIEQKLDIIIIDEDYDDVLKEYPKDIFKVLIRDQKINKILGFEN